MRSAAYLALGYLLQIGVQAKSESSIRGLNPALADKYLPGEDGLWQCLDGSKTIPFSAINDDYCDCPDGSDEPGTSACSNSTFYCHNEGHIPSTLFSSKVNDGLCDPECCDGSDENDGFIICPNICVEKGEIYRETVEKENKIRKTGSKIRSTYINFANQERIRLNTLIGTLEEEVKTKTYEVVSAQAKLDQYESKDKEWLQGKKKSPVYQSLLVHREHLKSLRDQQRKAKSDLQIIKDIFKRMQEDYNPNYQDMAVKHAIDEFKLLVGPEIVDQEEGDDSADVSDQAKTLDAELDKLEGLDVDSLLLQAEGENSDDQDEEDTLWQIERYLPESLLEPYEAARDQVLLYLIKFGILGRGYKSSIATTPTETVQTAQQREILKEAQQAERQALTDLTKNKDELAKLDTKYGPQAEWKKLENTCVQKDQGDYTYELCFFGNASQKKAGSATHLGTFSTWSRDPRAVEGTLTFYSKAVYDRGARCWNGPERSVKVDLACGGKNELLSISEPEKCEYLFKVTSPALCWPDASWEKAGGVKQEVKREEL